MSKRRKIKPLTLSHLAVAGVCFLAGFSVELWVGKQVLPKMVGGAMALQLIYPLYVETQRERGGYEQYRDALLDHNPLADLGLENPLTASFFGGPEYHSDRMLNYIRASRLADEKDHPADAERYMALAVENCAQSRLASKGCSADRIIGFLELFEDSRRDRKHFPIYGPTRPRKLLWLEDLTKPRGQ